MKFKIFVFVILTMIFVGCKPNASSTPDDHTYETNNSDEAHNHEEEVKIQFTSYSNDFEVFAEADPFVIGHKSNVLAHFTNLPDFTALEKGSVTIRLIVFGKETTQTLSKPTRKGIYSFNIIPENLGTGELIFDIKTDKGDFQLTAPPIKIFADEHDAIHMAEEMAINATNAISFTKEQSWKIDFATEEATSEPMGQVIKTTAQIHSAPNDEVLVTSGTVGVVILSDYGILEGKEVNIGQPLFSVSGSNLIDDNSQVRFKEAQNNFELASMNYERANKLAKDNIVSKKELQSVKNQYENAKVAYDNFRNNFSTSGQSVSSPVNGFIKQLLVQNGQYVDVGQPIVSISQNKSLFLHADVQQKYHSILDNINSATIRTMYDNQTYTLDRLNGKIISYGRTTNNHNFLIPINLEIDYIEGFMPGSFVELYLKTIGDEKALTVPN
ncbi:MAG: efflux RND transporter periplasmic adaptor subunit, partial [Bacteroidetes bacterium]|nr:efflux RND transporter periplasmic adaptor subunit [Bacteroidota bacterium]